MKWFRERNWGFIFVASFLFILLSCSEVKENLDLQRSPYVDSLILDAIQSSDLQDFELVIEKFISAINEAKAIGDYRNQILGNINLGLLYLNYNADEEALNYLLLSLDLTSRYKVDELLNTIYNNIGIIYSSNGEFNKAEEYFLKALKISQQRNEKERVAINLVNLGELKSEENKTDQAFDYYQQSLELFQELKDTINIAVVLDNIGNVFYRQENYIEAKSHFQQALQLKKELNKFYLPYFQLHYGKNFFQFQEYDSSLVYLYSALDSFLVIKNTEKIIESYDWLAKTHEVKGGIEQAMKYYEKCSNWKDTLLQEKNKLWVSEIQMKYEFGKREKEIEFLQHKAKQDKLILGSSILAILVFSALLFYFLKIKNTNLKQKNIILEKEQEVSNLEISKNQLLQKQLKQKLEMKNRELASKALHLLNKNEILSSITTLLDQIKVGHETPNANWVRKARRTITRNIDLDEQWEDFKTHFEEVHTGFFSRMVKDYPLLSQTDLRLSAYLVINLNNIEIAQISNISPDSVRKRKQRLREKLNLDKEQDLRTILSKYELV